MAVSPLVVPPRGRTIGTDRSLLATLAVLFVGFGLLGGLYGLAVAATAAIVLALAGPLIAYLSGTIVLLGLNGVIGLDPLVGHLLLVTLLVGAVTAQRGRRTGLLAVLVVTTYVGLFIGISTVVDSLLTTTAVLTVLAVCLSYGLHRYELLTMGLIDE